MLLLLLLLLLLPPLALAFLPLPLPLVLLDMSLCARAFGLVHALRLDSPSASPKARASAPLVHALVACCCSLVCLKWRTARGEKLARARLATPTRTRDTWPVHGACAALAGCFLASTNPALDPNDAWARSPRLHQPRPLGLHQAGKESKAKRLLCVCLFMFRVLYLSLLKRDKKRTHTWQNTKHKHQHTRAHTKTSFFFFFFFPLPPFTSKLSIAHPSSCLLLLHASHWMALPVMASNRSL